MAFETTSHRNIIVIKLPRNQIAITLLSMRSCRNGPRGRATTETQSKALDANVRIVWILLFKAFTDSWNSCACFFHPANLSSECSLDPVASCNADWITPDVFWSCL